MKYLKKSAEVLIGNAGSQSEQKLRKYGLTDHTAMLTLVTHYSDGSGEELSSICVTREHLEQMRKAIDDYLSKIDSNAPTSEKVGSVNNFKIKAETGLTEAQALGVFGQVSQQVKQMLQNTNQQKQIQLVIDPKLVMVNQYKPTGEPDSWFAKIHVLTGLMSDSDGRLELSVLGDSEENARKELNIGFHNLIMACVNPDLSESRIPDIVQENQRPVSKSGKQDNSFKNPVNSFGFKSEFDEEKPARFFGTLNELMSEVTTSKNTNGVWEAKIVYGRNGSNGLISFGDTETEARAKLYQLVETWKDQLFSRHSFCVNEPENSKQTNEAGVNPDSNESRVPNIVQENQHSVDSAQDTKIKSLKFDLNGVTSKMTTSKKISEKWEARIVYWWNGCERELIAFGETEIKARTQLYKGLEGLQDLLSPNCPSDANEPENSKQTNEAGDKDSTQFKLNPSRVMSMKIGVDKWEARTRIFNGINPGLTNLVATGVSEEAAREELDKKFSDFAGSMTNFIKFMSQAS